MKAAAIILAAGESSRMGEPKALLTLNGETFVDRLVAAFDGACDPVIVVTGYHSEAVRAGARRNAVFVENPHPRRGMLSSLQCGIAAVPGDCEGALFMPVDQPRVTPETIRAVLAASDALLAAPVCLGKRGHPVWIRRDLFAEFAAELASAREVIHRHAAERREVPVDDAGVLDDIDTPDDYRRLTA